jgi:ubiquinone/menaquinone biosynthesis C-methylase UbiE
MTTKLLGPTRPISFQSYGKEPHDSLLLRRRATGSPLPIPHRELMEYGERVETHLESGAHDAETIRNVLTEAGYIHEDGNRVLDLGCSNGRVLRWFEDWAVQGEAWGVDINANMVLWAQANLSPPFHFLVSTTEAHLPFEGRYFNVVFCNSLFTHIDDQFTAWIQELRRVTTLGGFLYITIHDEDAFSAVEQSHRPLSKVKNDPAFTAYAEEGYDFLALWRGGVATQVFIRRAYFEELMTPWFKFERRLSNTIGGFQGGYLFRRMT